VEPTNEPTPVEPVPGIAVGDVPEMSVEEAEVHMHNFAHSFLSPLVLLGAWRRMKAELAKRDVLSSEIEQLTKQQEQLRTDVERRIQLRNELTSSVEQLAKRQQELSNLIARDAATMAGG
jgi:outer membrane murein-binding lipoprotein Lpp